MLDAVLLGKTRSALLREMFLNPDRRLSFNELVRRVNSGDGAVARELRTLIDAGLVAEQREGNQRFLTARRDSPVFAELKSFISKTSGAPFILREALTGLEKEVAIAFIFGSVAKGREREGSDLDLFSIGTAGYSQLTEKLYSIEERLGRRVQVLYFDSNSEQDRKSLRNPSMRAILAGPKLFVLGDESRLASLIEVRKAKGARKR
ncbi:MAG: nucleotidyltransferase domain-containing protein [Steroidobacteraceae bacterium]